MNPNRKAVILAALDILELPSNPSNPSPPKPPKSRKFLPGETRATCGIDGFTPLNAQAYVRKLYSNAEPRNHLTKHTTPNQFLGPTGEITSDRKHISPLQNNEWVFISSDPHFPARWKKIHKELVNENTRLKNQTTYCEHFLLSLLTAQYVSWKIGEWQWSQATTQCEPKIIHI